MMPRNNPITEAVYEKKFIKSVDSMTCTNMRNGRIIPSITRIKPIKIN